MGRLLGLACIEQRVPGLECRSPEVHYDATFVNLVYPEGSSMELAHQKADVALG